MRVVHLTVVDTRIYKGIKFRNQQSGKHGPKPSQPSLPFPEVWRPCDPIHEAWNEHSRATRNQRSNQRLGRELGVPNEDALVPFKKSGWRCAIQADWRNRDALAKRDCPNLLLGPDARKK
jgi:hypothetical protein